MHFSRTRLASLTGLALVILSFAGHPHAAADAPTSSSTPAPAATTAAPRVTWEAFASLDDRPGAAPVPPAARLLFFRPSSVGSAGLPADIFVNARLLTALLPGGFAEVDVCEGPVRLSLGGQGTTGLRPSPEQTLQARAGQITYVMVQAPNATEPLREIGSAEQARPQLASLRRQTHAVSRVPSTLDCKPSAAAPVLAAAPLAKPAAAPAQSTRYTLSAEMLFRFGGSKLQDMSQQGRQQVLALADQIKQELRPGQTILIQGHTDPSGSPALNQRLSQERAETVKSLLASRGLPAQQLRSEGLGATQAVVKNCERSTRTRDDRINCDRPNRRVEINVSPLKN